MKALFVAWQDPESRRWLPVGRLRFLSGHYEFRYTHGAINAQSTGNFRPFGRMTDLGGVYISDKLFPLFSNRVLPKSRPEYRKYLGWLGITESDHMDLEVLARTGGQRATDSLELFPMPEPDVAGNFSTYFFSRGIRHLSQESVRHVSELKPGDRLFLMRDIQNAHDEKALLMRTDDPVSLVGYCPRYFAGEFCRLIDEFGAARVRLTVDQVNIDAPSQLRLLCRLQAPWPVGFNPFAEGDFEPIQADTRDQGRDAALLG